MESNDELSYFDDIIKIEDFGLDNILIDERSCNLVYDISYKTWIVVKPLHIQFNKVDGFFSLCWD